MASREKAKLRQYDRLQVSRLRVLLELLPGVRQETGEENMSLDKAIEHGKERRKPYRGSKAIDPTCRNHGSCPVCEENRKHKFRDKHPREDSEE